MRNILILAGLCTPLHAKSQVVCHTADTVENAVKYLNDKIKGDMILYDGVKWDKEASKYEKAQLIITPKTVSAPTLYDKTICVTVTD